MAWQEILSRRDALLAKAKIIPVITLERLEDAVPLAQSLVAGGIPLLEITLRTPIAFAAAEVIIRHVPEAIVGIGTITCVEELQRAQAIGAQFALSPGFTPKLLEAASALALPYIPGVQTAAEIMQALEWGFDVLKFFPAQQAGGRETLKAFSGPFEQVRFCPTGGITAQNAPDWLALSNVVAVGGSWLAPSSLINAKNWSQITQNARHAATTL
jgi:2-dehydro-3-deoxyphosphogluconate aldolase / (4S)-4-hydroxy-2-oxoglutarate aldolase